MTTTNVEVKDLPKPGTIVFVQDSSDMRDSLFGLVTTFRFFTDNASERAVSTFEEAVSGIPKWGALVPVMVMLEDFSWVIRFRQRHHSTLFDSLLDDDEVLNKCLRRMHCFTHRDGSRYYSLFVDHLCYYLKFLSGKEKIEDFTYLTHACPLERKFLEHLMEYRDEQRRGFFACTPS